VRRQTAGAEMRFSAIKIILGEDAQADPLAGGFGAGLEHDAVVAAFLKAAQVERVVIVVAHHEAKRVDIESAALCEIAHAMDDVARARDVERGPEDRIGNAHGLLSLRSPQRLGKRMGF